MLLTIISDKEKRSYVQLEFGQDLHGYKNIVVSVQLAKKHLTKYQCMVYAPEYMSDSLQPVWARENTTCAPNSFFEKSF